MNTINFNTVTIPFLWLMFSMTLSNAQEDTTKNFIFYGIAGIHVSDYSFQEDRPIEIDGKPGIHIGGGVDYRFGETFGLASELLISSYAGEYQVIDFVDVNNPILEKTYDLREILLQVPILLRTQVNTWLDIKVGPQILFPISQDFPNTLSAFVEKTKIENTSFGLVLEAGGAISKNFRIGARVNIFTRDVLTTSFYGINASYFLN